jgi:FimV-like protein
MPSTQERDLPIPSSDPVPDLPAADADSLGVADVSTEVPPAGPPFEPLPGLDATAEAEATDTSPVDDFAAVAPAVAAAGESAPMESTEPFPAPESIDASEPVSSAEPVEAPERVQDPVPAALPEELPVEVAKEPAEPVLPPESAEAMAAAPAQPYRAVLPEPGQPLPDAIEVQRGDTLWGLSGAYAEAQGVSINQVMLAVQQKNRDAFIEDNINAMMAGQVLRMPTREEMVSRSARDAMLEVLRQESLYRTRWDLPPSPDALPTISNLADAGTGAATNLAAESPTDAALPPATAEAEAAEEDSRLVLVPPSEDDSQASQGMGQGGSGETGISTGESVVEELARAREELANAEQENAYLEERLAELEAELARREAGEDTGGVADTNLAEMEDRLRDERLAGEEEPELAMPPRESSWLSSYGPALAGLLVLALATLVWFLRSRRDPEFTVGMEAPATPNRAGNGVEAPPSNANGAESDDPETLLDLARAYMAMGKNTQARDCIEAVTRSGTPAQVREARTMLAEL